MLLFWATEYMHYFTSYIERTLCHKWLVHEYSGSHFLPRVPVTFTLSCLSDFNGLFCTLTDLLLEPFFFVLQANSRKRKPRGKKNKTVKPKVDEVAYSLSSAPPSEKSSEDEDDKEDEKVCNADWYRVGCFVFLPSIVFWRQALLYGVPPFLLFLYYSIFLWLLYPHSLS